MPLIKRKPVELVPPPRKDEYDTDVPVFYLKETGEIFPDYEDFAQRLSFYRQRIFQCELSGRIHLTFFEAVKSERKQSALVHRSFPEALKGPILRSVQFYVTGRIDELVDLIFDRFKDRFFEEETVVLDIHGDRFIAAIRGIHPSRSLTKRREEEVALATKVDNDLARKAVKKTDGEDDESELSDAPMSDDAQPPPPAASEVKLELKDIAHIIGTDLNRDENEAQKEDHPIDDYLYSVQLLSADGEDDFSMARMERRADNLSRDRLSFSKTILKKYLKECVVRDASVGSPWTVKPLLAEKYGISTQASDDVEEKNRLIKEEKLIKRRKYLDDVATTEDGKPVAKKPRKSKAEEAKAEAERKEEEERRKAEEKRKKMIKYPIEDLLLEPLAEAEADVKTEDPPPDVKSRRERPVPKANLLPVGKELFEPLMNSYLFLQACGKPLLLSPFHLDDFEAALKHNTHDPPCHLLGEIHAALLNVIVRDMSNSKAVTVKPAAKGAASEEEDEFDEEKNQSEDEEMDVGGQEEEEEDEMDEMDELDSEASSVAASSIASGPEEGDAVDGEADTGVEKRKGEDVYAASRKLGRGWEAKILRSDNFRAGWEYSLCGMLNKRATPDTFPRALAVLSHLTGIGNFARENGDAKDEEGSARKVENDLYLTPVQRFSTLSLKDKIAVLQFLCEQAVMTRAIKRYFDDCELQLTELRKERVELGRARRKLAEDRSTFEDGLKKDSDEEGEEAEEEDVASGEEAEGEEGDDDDEVEEEDAEEEEDHKSAKTNGKHAKKAANGTKGGRKSALTQDDESIGEEDEMASTGAANSDDDYDSSATGDDAERKYRRNFGSRQEAMRIRAIQREAEEADRLARLRQEKAEQKVRMQENRQIALERKRLDDEEARINKREEAIEREFRQHSQVGRLHPLGRDRFLDKYWWFDGVGAATLYGPHGQVQYSTGRLFVQGPSEEEWGLLADEYAPGADALLQRRRQEHAEEGVLGHDQWGVYTEPEEIDALMTWLRAKGVRELALRQQLHRFRFYLQPGMQKRNHDLTGGWKDNVETRRSNRTKDNAASRPPYMSYRNAFAKGV